jgi:hypothetical protein
LRDQLAATGTKVEDKELVSIALNGFVPSWKPFVQGVCVHQHLPIYEKLWDNIVQEVTRLLSCSVKQKQVEDLTIVGRMRKDARKDTRRVTKKNQAKVRKTSAR